MAEERISELDDIQIESMKTKKLREQRLREEKQNRLSKNCGTTTKDIT